MANKKWNESEIDFLKNNYCKNGTEYCAKNLNRSKNSIIRKSNRLSLKVDKKTTSKILKNKIKKNWENNSENILINNLNKKLLTDLTYIDENFAYVLGFLWGDGYIYNAGIGKPNYISLEILKEDGEEIKNVMLSILKWNIYYRKRKGRKETIKFTFNNRLLVEYLCNFNFNKKSYSSPDKLLSKMNENVKKYFFLGLSDADGNFYFNDKTYIYQYHISSSLSQDWSYLIKLFEKLNIKYKVEKRKHKNNDGNFSQSSSIRITNKGDVLKFGNYLYNDEYDIGLSRKFKKFKKLNKIKSIDI